MACYAPETLSWLVVAMLGGGMIAGILAGAPLWARVFRQVKQERLVLAGPYTRRDVPRVRVG